MDTSSLEMSHELSSKLLPNISPETASTQTEFELLKTYVMTLQTCKKCGVCFQNRFRVYCGEFPLCHTCRRLNRHLVAVVNYKTIHMRDTPNNNLPQFSTKEQYVIPMKKLSIEMLKSLNALQNTIISSVKVIDDESGLSKRILVYEDPVGEYFFTHFKQVFECYKKPFNSMKYSAHKIYNFTKCIQ